MNEENIKQEILTQEDQLLKAMLTADVVLLDELFHEKLLFNIPGGQTITKSMDIEAYTSGTMKVKDISVNDRMVNIIDDSAVVVASVQMEGQYYEHQFNEAYRFIRVWKSVGGKWKLIAGSSSPIQ